MRYNEDPWKDSGVTNANAENPPIFLSFLTELDILKSSYNYLFLSSKQFLSYRYNLGTFDIKGMPLLNKKYI